MPLHKAALNGHLEICELIVKYLEDKNPRNKDCVTPLQFAALSGHLAVCEHLLAPLGNKNPATNSGFTPLHAAAENGHSKVYELIMKSLETKILKPLMFNLLCTLLLKMAVRKCVNLYWRILMIR